MTAGILRAKVNVKWDKDRGTDPDGSERINDRHLTLAEKRAARGQRVMGEGTTFLDALVDALDAEAASPRTARPRPSPSSGRTRPGSGSR